MSATDVQIPQELLDLLKRSRLATRPVADQVRVALAIQLLQEGVISIGRAAEIAQESQRGFEKLLAEMGIPTVRYDMSDYERELEAVKRLRNTEL